MPLLQKLTRVLKTSNIKPTTTTTIAITAASRRLSSKTGNDEWNDAWETSWLPEDLSDKSSRAAWESDVAFSLPNDSVQSPQSALPEEMDPETAAFVEDMNGNWDQRKGKSVKRDGVVGPTLSSPSSSESHYILENIKRDYRLRKQRIHAGLWVKEIEKMEEGKLGTLVGVDGDDFEKLLDCASEIFDSPNNEFDDLNDSISELKNKPDGWETTWKNQDGNIWDMSQREEDILVQEFERRISYNKFQIASFIKTHIFSRRRPIDGWKYMIEVIGPNARKGKGSVVRLPSVSDESTQPFREEKPKTYPRT